MDIDNGEQRNTGRMNLTLKLKLRIATIDRDDESRKKRKKKWRATSETIDDPRSVSVNLIYIHGARVTSWLSILGSLGYRSHRWTSRGLIYRRTALPRLSEFVLERFRYRHSIDHKVLIKLESYLYKVTLSL